MVVLNSKNFDEEVKNSKGTVLVDFYADWCGPCKMLSPVLAEIDGKDTDAKICKVNVDEEVDLARTFGVMSIPCLIVFKDGEVINKTVGLKSKSEVLDLLK